MYCFAYKLENKVGNNQRYQKEETGDKEKKTPVMKRLSGQEAKSSDEEEGSD